MSTNCPKIITLLSLYFFFFQVSLADINKEIDLETFKGGVGIAPSSISEEEYMHIYTKYLESLDILFSPPEDFHLKERENRTIFTFCPDEDFRSPYYIMNVGLGAYTPPYFSQNEDALIIYPLACSYGDVCNEGVVEAELIASYSNDKLDCTNLISFFEGQDIPGSTNADKILIYNLNTSKSNHPEYSQCLAIALRKKNHFAMQIKILLTDEGYKNKYHYMNVALNTIKYGDNSLPECVEMEKKVKDEGIFPKKKRIRTVIPFE